MSTTPPPSRVPRPCSQRHDEQDTALAELRAETGKHAQQLFAQANELDDLRVHGAALRAEATERGVQVDRIEKATIEIAAEMQQNNKLQRRVLVEQKESNALKRRQEAQLREAVAMFIAAVRSPRALAAITLGALLAGFFFALFERIFR